MWCWRKSVPCLHGYDLWDCLNVALDWFEVHFSSSVAKPWQCKRVWWEEAEDIERYMDLSCKMCVTFMLEPVCRAVPSCEAIPFRKINLIRQIIQSVKVWWGSWCWATKQILVLFFVCFNAEEGGRDYVIATINWHSKIKKYGYRVNKRLYGQSSDGCNGRARCSTKLNMPGS